MFAGRFSPAPEMDSVFSLMLLLLLPLLLLLLLLFDCWLSGLSVVVAEDVDVVSSRMLNEVAVSAIAAVNRCPVAESNLKISLSNIDLNSEWQL